MKLRLLQPEEPSENKINDHQAQVETTGADSEAITANPFHPMLEKAKRQATKWRRRRRLFIIGSSVTFITLFSSMMLLTFFAPGGLPLEFVPVAFVMLASLVTLLYGIIMRPLGRNALHTLWATEDKRAVGAMVEATQMLLSEITPLAQSGLIRLLPRLEATDALLLNNYHRDCLRRMLGGTPIQSPDYEAVAKEGVPLAQVDSVPDFL